MERYISAEKAKEILLKNLPDCRNCAEEIDSVPTEDVEPAVHAHWVDVECDGVDYKCSNCDDYAIPDRFGDYNRLTDYCPHCGAKMDEVTTDG